MHKFQRCTVYCVAGSSVGGSQRGAPGGAAALGVLQESMTPVASADEIGGSSPKALSPEAALQSTSPSAPAHAALQVRALQDAK